MRLTTTTKYIMNKLASILLLFITLTACTHTPVDYPEEDYSQLFPFKGFEKPNTNYEEMPLLVGDPETTPESFVYPGVTFPTKRLYKAKLVYSYSEPASLSDGFDLEGGTGALRPQADVRSRVIIRYMGADNKLHELGTGKAFSGAQLIPNDGREHTIEFDLSSGQPLYLIVTGFANRGGTISASLSARSTDGLFTTPPLESTQSQNADEGEARLPNPYCKYIILP